MIQEVLKNNIGVELMDSIYNSIIITSGRLNGPEHPKILYANKSFERITGYSAKDVIGKTPRILQGPKTNKEVLIRLKKTLANQEFFEGNTVNYKKDGTPYYVEWNITPILDENGKTQYFFCVQKDVTESIKYKEYLEQRVKEELAKVKEQELLIQKQSQLAAMGEMIDAIAHQWLNPLTKMKLKIEMASIILEDEDIQDQELHKYINDSYNTTIHLEETLREFRGFFRPVKELEDICLNDVINQTLLLVKDELCSNQIDVECKNLESKIIKMIKNEFKHVLINLLMNSKDAFIQNNIENRKITIEGVDTKECLTLLIYDNAGGIPKNILDKVFDQHVTTKEKSGGTGIGLYMCKQIINKHDYTIDVKNIENGACFTISFR